MLDPIGKETPALPRKMSVARVLEEFDGPILSELHATPGVYIEKWCDCDHESQRVLIVRSEPRAVAEYLSGRLSTLGLLEERSDAMGFLIDRYVGGERIAVVALCEVKHYLPTADVFHDPALRPSWPMVPHSYLFDDDWDAALLSKCERDYFNAAAFAYFADPTAVGLGLPPSIFDFKMDGGFPIVSTFGHLRQRLPLERRPRSVAVAAGSPGVLTIETEARLAGLLTRAIDGCAHAGDAYRDVYKWSRLRTQYWERVPHEGYAQMEVLCRHLNVDVGKLYKSIDDGRGYQSNRQDRSATLLAAKLATAYFRVLRRVVSPDARATFVGLPFDVSAISQFDDDDLMDDSL